MEGRHVIVEVSVLKFFRKEWVKYRKTPTRMLASSVLTWANFSAVCISYKNWNSVPALRVDSQSVRRSVTIPERGEQKPAQIR